MVAFCHENYDDVKEREGREKADACAVLMAEAIGASMGREDSLFRCRENGYVLCLPYREETAARETARRAAEGILSRLPAADDGSLPFLLRIGVASVEDRAVLDGESLVELAFSRFDDQPAGPFGETGASAVPETAREV